MGVVFESCIKVDPDGKWYIVLKDTLNDKIAVCRDLDEYSQKIEELGAEYGANIDEVKWSKDDNVPPHTIDELRLEMSRHQEEIEKQK
jgi:hypothetical protein